MEFIKLNYWKLFRILCLCILVWSFFTFLAYRSISAHSSKSELSEDLPILFMYMYGAAVAIFMLFLFWGLYYFYRAPKLFSYVLSLDIFDDGNFRNGYTNNRSWLFYTQKCLIGNIQQYPASIWINQVGGARRGQTNIAISLHVKKNDKTDVWFFQIALNSKQEPEKNIKLEIANNILLLTSKGYISGELSEGLKMDDTIFSN